MVLILMFASPLSSSAVIARLSLAYFIWKSLYLQHTLHKGFHSVIMHHETESYVFVCAGEAADWRKKERKGQGWCFWRRHSNERPSYGLQIGLFARIWGDDSGVLTESWSCYLQCWGRTVCRILFNSRNSRIPGQPLFSGTFVSKP